MTTTETGGWFRVGFGATEAHWSLLCPSNPRGGYPWMPDYGSTPHCAWCEERRAYEVPFNLGGFEDDPGVYEGLDPYPPSVPMRHGEATP